MYKKGVGSSGEMREQIGNREMGITGAVLPEGLLRDVEVGCTRFDLALQVNLPQGRSPRHVLSVFHAVELDLQRYQQLDPVRKLQQQGNACSVLLFVRFHVFRGPGERVLRTATRFLAGRVVRERDTRCLDANTL